jgi:ATP-dependent protease ClpP protease subunit
MMVLAVRCCAAMLHQPRVPPTGQRQAVEIAIKWKEVLAQKNAMLDILSKTTGHSPTKLDKVLDFILQVLRPQWLTCASS